VSGDELRAAVAAACRLLGELEDPAAAVPLLQDDVAGVAAHLTGTLVWYAQDLAAGPRRTDGFRLEPAPEAALPERLRQLAAAAEVLARTVDAAAPGERGWHDWGLADASGFAAMGCAELLVHTGDVAEALALRWAPPGELADAVLTRLFPWAEPGGDPAGALRWATGRAALPGREQVTTWRWHCAPLEEWDGAVPN
jgi:hypothetical protein